METVSVRSDTSAVVSQTEVTQVDANEAESQPVLRLRLKKPKTDRKVEWREDTIDNEDMGKKKSKCCCIYKKPHAFGESSSEDDEECEHCFGHPEKRKRNRKHPHTGSDDKLHDDNNGDGDVSNKHENNNAQQPSTSSTGE